MRSLASVAVFVSGLLLYGAALYAGGSLAAITVPRTYFEFFGVHKLLALVVEEACVYALPVFLFASTWAYASVRPFGAVHRPATLWCLAGAVVGWIGWTLHDFVAFANDPMFGEYSLGALALLMIVPPVSGVLNVAAAPGGVVVGGWLAGRSGARDQRLVSLPSN